MEWVRQLGWWHSQLNGKIIQMFQTTNQMEIAPSPLLQTMVITKALNSLHCSSVAARRSQTSTRVATPALRKPMGLAMKRPVRTVLKIVWLHGDFMVSFYGNSMFFWGDFSSDFRFRIHGMSNDLHGENWDIKPIVQWMGLVRLGRSEGTLMDFGWVSKHQIMALGVPDFPLIHFWNEEDLGQVVHD